MVKNKGCYQISIGIILADLLLFLIGQCNKLNQWIMSVPITVESRANLASKLNLSDFFSF